MNLLQAFSDSNNSYTQDVVKIKESTALDLTNL